MVKPYTDAMVQANNQEVAATNTLLTNDTPANRAAYQQAVLEADAARRAEAGEWYKVGGPGFPPSRDPGVLAPLPTGVLQLGQSGGDETLAAATPAAETGPNSTLSAGLGSLMGTIERGP